MKRKNAGMTTIVTVCVMAVIMALSLSLFLTASVLIRTAAKSAAADQCRILAVTFSEQIEAQLTDQANLYESRTEEAKARAEDAYHISLWHYVRQEIAGNTWPYYEEPGSALHSSENAIRTFHMGSSGTAGEIADTDISIYWTCGADEKTPEQLVVKTKVTVKEQSCTITDIYKLLVSGGDGYESWEWEHVDRK